MAAEPIAARLGCNLHLWGRKHAKEVRRKPLTGLPELKTDDLTRRRINFPQARIGLLARSGARVIALEANPGNVRFGVIVPFDPHTHRLASPHRDHPGGQRIVPVWVLVYDHEACAYDLPGCLSRVASPFTVSIEHRSLNIAASKAELPCLVKSMKRPSYGDGVCRHDAAGYRPLPSLRQDWQPSYIESRWAPQRAGRVPSMASACPRT
jgi:hypothetical protein